MKAKLGVVFSQQITKFATIRALHSSALESARKKGDVTRVFDEGRIQELGNHEDLIKRGGFYARLLGFQFGTGDSINHDAAFTLPSFGR